MSYAVVVPVTDLEHVKREIERERHVQKCIRRTRRNECLYQNVIRQIKRKKDETAK